MLIIFDLDDTLIDTSGSITPIKLRRALKRMMDLGLPCHKEEALLELLSINEISISSRDALTTFVHTSGGSSEMLEAALHEMYHQFSDDIPVRPLEGALELLRQLRRDHHLCLVTRGDPAVQLKKMEKAGIEGSIFSKIIVCGSEGKKGHYDSLRQAWSCDASDVWVCGDRVEWDLTPAKELGFITVHVKWGRGLVTNRAHPDVDFTLSSLKELPQLMNRECYDPK